VSGFCVTDTLQGLDLALGQTKVHEVAHGELGETLLVVLRLEVLGSQRTVFVRCCS
jgi:hypothetical protein